MPSYQVNERAVAGTQLIDARQYVLDSDWGEAQPGPTTRTRYLTSHSWQDYGSGIWPDRRRDRRDEGSLRVRVRRLPAGPPEGLIACQYRAAEWRHKAVEPPRTISSSTSTRRARRDRWSTRRLPEDQSLIPTTGRPSPTTTVARGWRSPEVQAWSEAQNARARAILDGLPGVADLGDRLTRILAAETTTDRRARECAGRLFAMRRQPAEAAAVPGRHARPGRDRRGAGPARSEASTKSGTTAIDWYVPSPDGKLVAVSLSKGGSESGDVHVYDVETGSASRTWSSRGSRAAPPAATWPGPPTARASSTPATRAARSGRRADLRLLPAALLPRARHARPHDRYELGKDLPRIAEIRLETRQPTGRLLATVQNGDGGEFALLPPLARREVAQIAGVRGQARPGRVRPKTTSTSCRAPTRRRARCCGWPPRATTRRPTVVVPEGDDTIVTDFYTSARRRDRTADRDAAVRHLQLGGPTRDPRASASTASRSPPHQPEVGAVDR